MDPVKGNHWMAVWFLANQMFSVFPDKELLMQALAKDLPWKLKESRVLEILHAVRTTVLSPKAHPFSLSFCSLKSFLVGAGVPSTLLFWLFCGFTLLLGFFRMFFPVLIVSDRQQHWWYGGFLGVRGSYTTRSSVRGTWLGEVATEITGCIWEIRHW